LPGLAAVCWRTPKPRSNRVTAAINRVARTAWRNGDFASGDRAIPEETAIAFTYNGTSYAVMMATPQDLEDFALGFSLTEGIVSSADEIAHLEIVEEEVGIELRMRLSPPRTEDLRARRRRLAGPTGSGLCGVESLAEAIRASPVVSGGILFTPRDIMRAVESVTPAQTINRATHAAHAAGFWEPTCGLVELREDVGRHNALDKLGGALARGGIIGRGGLIVMTSRVSVDIVQKAAYIGVPLIVAISAPTALAVRMATSAGITLIAIARGNGFEVFTRPERITSERIAFARPS